MTPAYSPLPLSTRTREHDVAQVREFRLLARIWLVDFSSRSARDRDRDRRFVGDGSWTIWICRGVGALRVRVDGWVNAGNWIIGERGSAGASGKWREIDGEIMMVVVQCECVWAVSLGEENSQGPDTEV